MTIGFTITDFNGHEKEAVKFIRRTCILESPQIAQNIVDAGPGVNVFSPKITDDELLRQPFSTVPIKTQPGKCILVSTVNFPLEIEYNGGILKLSPTEYIYVNANNIGGFMKYSELEIIQLISENGENIIK